MKSLFTVLKTDKFHEELNLLEPMAQGYHPPPPSPPRPQHTHKTIKLTGPSMCFFYIFITGTTEVFINSCIKC